MEDTVSALKLCLERVACRKLGENAAGGYLEMGSILVGSFSILPP
jgi:hypothetical protein